MITKLPFTLAAALLLTAPGTTAAQRETETVDRTVALPSNGTVELRNFSGPVRITAGSGTNVVIKAVRRARREQLDRIRLTIETSGSRVVINANDRDDTWTRREENVVETEFDIQVPPSARLDVNAFSSDVTVTGVGGTQRLKTFNGDITVTGAGDAVTATTFSGDLEIDLSAAGASPEVSAETFSGDIRLRLASGATGRIEFDSFSGSFESDLPVTLRSSGRRRMSVELPGGPGRTLRLHTFSGDAHVVR